MTDEEIRELHRIDYSFRALLDTLRIRTQHLRDPTIDLCLKEMRAARASMANIAMDNANRIGLEYHHLLDEYMT